MFTGAFTAMVTPFRNGKVDEVRLREQIEYQISQGIDGLVPVGTSVQSPTLYAAEHVRVMSLTVEFARKRVPVIGGTGGNATNEAMELHRHAKAAGCDACLSVNPYYNKPTQEGLYRHFMTLADAIDLPIIFYNIPGRTGVTMSPQTVARLRQANPKAFIGIKEATGSIDMASEIRSLCDIPIYSGDDSLTLSLMAVGAVGVVSVLSNLIPGDIRKMVHLAGEGRFKDATAIHHRLFPLMRAMFLDGNPVGIKWAMKVAGRDSGEMRLPLWEASEATKKQISELMGKLGIK